MQNLRFAFGQIVDPGGCVGRRSGAELHEIGDQPPGHAGGDERVAASHDSNGGDQLIGRGVLQEEPRRAGAQ